MASLFDKIVIVGAGLIGSSIAQAARRGSVSRSIFVVDRSAHVRRIVEELAFADSIFPNAKGICADADLVVLCTPIGEFPSLTAQIAPTMRKGAILSDVGSVKGTVVREVGKGVPRDVHFVPAHPIAGAPHSGPEYASAQLFDEHWCILTPSPQTPKSPVEHMRVFWQRLGCKVEIMAPEVHDQILAITSHIPHAVAYAAVETVSKLHVDVKKTVERMFLPSIAAITRTAQADPTIWRDIFLSNRTQILETLSALSSNISDLERAIRSAQAADGQTLARVGPAPDRHLRIVDNIGTASLDHALEKAI